MSYNTNTIQDNTLIKGLRGQHATVRLSLLEAGPNSAPHAALIPQASVIQSSRYPAQEQATVELSYGDVIEVQGHGPHKVVRNKMSRDWPRLVPQFGPRFYVEFEGMGQWKVLDRANDGAFTPIPAEVRESLGMHKYAIHSLAEAEAAAALMSLSASRADALVAA